MKNGVLAQWPWGPFIAEWLHIFLGIFWFGGSLYVNFVVIPAILGLPPERQREPAQRIARIGKRVIRPVALGTILLGILRGTVWGRITSLDVLFGTRYGIVWLIALVAAIATYSWAEALLTPTAERLYERDEAWAAAPGGGPSPVFVAQSARLRNLALAELLGFLVIFTCMVILQFS